jgi:hypothetical protein
MRVTAVSKERRQPEVMTFGQLAAEITGLENGRGRCVVVGIDGMSGSGKTVFAHRLAAELAAPVLSTDDLVPGWDGLAESVRLLTDWVLRPLAAGQPARWRRYDWVAGRPGEWADLDPGAFLVVEGCGTGVFPAAEYLSYLIWIDAPAAERRRRLQQREDWAAYAPFADRWARQEAALQARADTPGRADVVVDNSAGTPPGGLSDSFARISRARTRGTPGTPGTPGPLGKPPGEGDRRRQPPRPGGPPLPPAPVTPRR